jgi:hypothetical protein
MNTCAKQLMWLTTLILAALVFGALVAAPVQAVSWDAGGAPSILWATPENWDGDVVPGSSDDVIFNETGAVALTDPPTVTNEVDADTTINTLWYSQQQDPETVVHTTQIDLGVTLNISGNTDPTASGFDGFNGNYSLFAGNNGSSSVVISQTVITGGGTLDISNAGSNTGGDIMVRETQGGSGGTNNAILDLSGLASFNANVDQLLVGFASGTSSSNNARANAVLYLAQSNTITMNNTGETTDAGLIIGYAGRNASGKTSYLYLGQTNTLNVDNATIGARRQRGTLTFNPAVIDPSLPVPTLTMRGVSDTRVALIAIGDNINVNSGSTSDAIGVMDLTGGSADIMATSIILGRCPSGSATGSRGGQGTLTFDTGTIDTTGMIVGVQSGDWVVTSSIRGTVNVAGTGHLIVGSSGIILAQNLGTTGTIPSGTLNITGGMVTLGADITDGGGGGGGASTLNMTGGILDMQGYSIGDPSAPIDTISLENCTLDNILQINADTLTISDGVTLNVSLGDVDLSYCHFYDILNWNTLSGTFATVNLPDLSPGLHWDDSNLYVTGIIHVVPEPATLVMLLMGAVMFYLRRRC